LHDAEILVETKKKKEKEKEKRIQDLLNELEETEILKIEEWYGFS
jgi:hypothetical protein